MNGMTNGPSEANGVRGVVDVASHFDGAFMAIDIVDSSAALLARDEWEGFTELRRVLADVTTSIVARGGCPLKNLGDGLEAVFKRPADALSCAVDLLSAATKADGEGLNLYRIGLTAGCMIRYATPAGMDVFGHCVIIGAKLAKLGSAPALMCPDQFPGASQLGSLRGDFRATRFEARIGGIAQRYWRLQARDPEERELPLRLLPARSRWQATEARRHV